MQQLKIPDNRITPITSVRKMEPQIKARLHSELKSLHVSEHAHEVGQLMIEECGYSYAILVRQMSKALDIDADKVNSAVQELVSAGFIRAQVHGKDIDIFHSYVLTGTPYEKRRENKNEMSAANRLWILGLIDQLPITPGAKKLGTLLVKRLGFQYSILTYQIVSLTGFSLKEIEMRLSELIEAEIVSVQSTSQASYIVHKRLFQ